jgi:hypothetical protein
MLPQQRIAKVRNESGFEIHRPLNLFVPDGDNSTSRAMDVRNGGSFPC